MHWVISDVELRHTPPRQVVPPVHPFASSHAMPSFAGTPPRHWPFEHVSPELQKFPSSHGLPLLPGTATQVFAFSLHVPIMQTSPGGAQVFGSPTQLPAWHLSLIVQ